jgi:hypothetical protein
MKNSFRVWIALVVFFASLFTSTAINSASAEDCPVIEYSKINFGRTPTANWKNSEPVRVITWSSNVTFIQPDAVSSPFSETEQGWIEQAFNNFGEVLDSVAFQKVNASSNPDILIGYTLLSRGTIPTETTGGNFGLVFFSSMLQKGGIALLDPKLWPKNFTLFRNETTFILAIENEIANLLGVPDVSYTVKQPLVTVYDTSKLQTYGQTKLTDYDAAIVRQVYGESTCSSKYTTDARVNNLAADKIVGQQYLAKLVTPTPTPVPVAAATPTPTPTPVAIPSPSPTKAVVKATTITCIKGKTTKKVTAVKPKCPSGYKKKA